MKLLNLLQTTKKDFFYAKASSAGVRYLYCCCINDYRSQLKFDLDTQVCLNVLDMLRYHEWKKLLTWWKIISTPITIIISLNGLIPIPSNSKMSSCLMPFILHISSMKCSTPNQNIHGSLPQYGNTMNIVTLFKKDKTIERNRMSYIISLFYIGLDLNLNTEPNNILPIVESITRKIINENRDFDWKRQNNWKK